MGLAQAPVCNLPEEITRAAPLVEVCRSSSSISASRQVRPCCEKRVACFSNAAGRLSITSIRSRSGLRRGRRSASDPAAGPPALPSSPTRMATSRRRFSACLSLLTGDCRSAPRRAFRPRRRGTNPRYRHRGSITEESCKAGLSLHRVDTLHFLAQAVASLGAGFSAIRRTRSDMQLLENPEILGVEYQRATLAGYEIRE
jgi:hypothetical protein